MNILKKIILLLFLTKWIFNASAQQNLVTDPSFEESTQTTYCSDPNFANSPLFFETFKEWLQQVSTRTFLFSSGNFFPCFFNYDGKILNNPPLSIFNEVSLGVPVNFFGSQPAFSGANYAGLMTIRFSLGGSSNQGSGILGIKLKEPLKKDIEYLIRFRVSKMENLIRDAKYKIIVSKNIKNSIEPKSPKETIKKGEVSNSTSWELVSFTFTNTSNDEYEYLFFESTNSWPAGFNRAAGFYLDEVLVVDKCLFDHPCSRTADQQISPVYTHETVNSSHPVQIENLNNTKQATMIVQTLTQSVVLTKTVSCDNGITGPIYWDGKANGSQVSPATYKIILSLTNDCGTFEFTKDVQKISNFKGTVSDFQCNSCNVVTPEPCCSAKPDISIDNITICGPSPLGGFLYQSVNNINIGSNVTISGDADVTFFAGNEIIGTNPHDVAVTGANVVVAEIVPCIGKNKTSDNYGDNDNNVMIEYEEEEDNPVSQDIPDTPSTQTQQPGFNIYPNPYHGSAMFTVKSDKLYIDITGNDAAQVLIVVVDMLGIERYSKLFVLPVLSGAEAKEKNYTLAIDPEGKLLAGVYFVKVITDNGIFTQKLIVAR